ncbi:outer membrane beta-barrel protein [Nibrella viscosa]
MRSFWFTSILIAYTLLATAPSYGQTLRQRSTTEGLSLGIQGNVLSWSSDYFQYLDEQAGSGSGFGVRVGYGFTQRLEAFGQYDISFMSLDQLDAEAFRISSLTGGLRFNFRATTRPLRPYVELGYARRTGKLDQVVNGNSYDNLLFKGGALHVGGGLSYYVALPLAITLNGAFQGGGKSAIQVNGFDSSNRADVTTFRVSLGLILYLSEL